MKVFKFMRPLVLLVFVPFCACTSYQYSNKTNAEQTFVSPVLFDKPLDLASIVESNNPNAQKTRGVITTDMLVQGANLAVQGVKYLIDESKKKYNQEYLAGLNNQNFYANNSTIGSMDPSDIQFKGFSISRTFKDPKTKRKMALNASFSLDSSKYQDIYFNSKFYLKLDSIDIQYSKVKVNDSKWFLPWTWFLKKDKTFNLDMNIDVFANWIDQYGTIHSQIPFGNFILPLRNIPLEPNTKAQKAYFESLKGTPVSGSSYIIPRSVTYCTNARGKSKPCYGRGDFNLAIKVVESSKEDFVTKTLQDNSDQIFDNIKGEDLIKAIKKQD